MQLVVSSIKGGSGKSTLAISLADVLDANIIDHDNQGTIRITAQLGGRHKPINSTSEITKNHIIHDTPPYNIDTHQSLYKSADIIIIPTKVSDSDFLALQPLIENLRNKRLTKKAVIVFNDVRKPYNNTYKKVKKRYENNYTDIKKASTELTSLVGFSNVLAQPLAGQALREITQLVKELSII